MPPRLAPVDFASLIGFTDDDLLAAYRCFARSARVLVEGRAGARPALPPSPALVAAARAGLDADIDDPAGARGFFESRFRPFRVSPDRGTDGFLTGYYEPCVAGAAEETEAFGWPILARPADLQSFAPDRAPEGFPAGASAARRRSDGSLVPYGDREAIERERLHPIVWLRDAVEAFLIQVQGSAQIEFPDGRRARLVYDGRNGLPYTSIGRLLIEAGEIRKAPCRLRA